ncbi:protein SLENDER RICE1-LIKE 1-like [Phragmites australis]|uniref:protein SLENDER RICE1-LIKE 1-like n=1 Tax=Phragmites australis TaxID=29695 RepID=UPI002D77A7FC|nr:protein SLENDER RICE1-LIKE 1-like [Phragmites australis]
MAMGGAFPFQWPTEPADAGLDVSLSPLPTVVPDAGLAYYAAAEDMRAMALPDFAFPSTAADAALAAIRREEEEAAGIRLVHLLMSCAGAVQTGDHALASAHLADAHAALAAVSAASGIGCVAVHFTAALSRRLFPPASSPPPAADADHAFLYHHFYEAGPYLKFAHFTANQAILEAVQGCPHVHIIDFSLVQGLQWPALIQALALRPGGPPFMRLTGIGPPSPPGRDDLRDVGVRLADLARSVRVHFSFRGVAANRLDEIRPWMLQVSQGEAVVVNSVLQLHRLLANPPAADWAPIDAVLDCVASVRPRVFTVVEQEADHNKPGFLDRFTEALFYYSAVFDSLDAASGGAGDAVAEAYLEREIRDIVCSEGADRRERHEPLRRWRDRLVRAGLSAVPLGASALRQARMLVGLFSGEGHCVEEAEGCLMLGWHGRPLFSASAWRVEENHQSADSNVDGSSGGEESNISCSS